MDGPQGSSERPGAGHAARGVCRMTASSTLKMAVLAPMPGSAYGAPVARVLGTRDMGDTGARDRSFRCLHYTPAHSPSSRLRPTPGTIANMMLAHAILRSYAITAAGNA